MRHCAGFTLIEVLVALFVAALGIAGAAGLQTLALRTQQEALRLSEGSRLLASLAERMRANPAAMGLDDAANPYLAFDYGTDGGAPAAASPCYADAVCNAVQLAQFDLFETAQAVAGLYRGGRIKVCRDANPVPAWDCAGGSGAPLVAKLGWREGAAGQQPEASAPRLRLVLAGVAP
jgi:type IV pilus assembly protein PilV